MELVSKEDTPDAAGRLAHIPITSYYGNQLTDQQRVDRFNDLRALQLLMESGFDDSEVTWIDTFLQNEKVRRTKQEAMEYYEKRMDTIDHKFVYTQYQKHVKRLEQARQRSAAGVNEEDADLVNDLLDSCKFSEAMQFSEPQAEDEDELGSTEPEAFKLNVEDFKKGVDYVKGYVRETRKLHRSDARNEVRRRESLGYSFKTENLQPKAMRKPLVDKAGKALGGESYHLTAIVPVLKETYRAKFNGTKKPNYTRTETEPMRDSHVMGVLTAAPVGSIPPVTLCEQYNDLRADKEANTVFTYVFASMDAESMQVEVRDAQDTVIKVIKEQDFERQHKAKQATAGASPHGFKLPDNLNMEDLLEFN